MKRIIKPWLFVFGLCLTTHVQAKTFSCRVNPALYLAINASGIVYTSVDGVGILGICSMGNQMGTIHPDACKGWYSTLLTYKSTLKQGWFYFDSDYPINSGKTNCAGFAQWDTREPYHFESGQ